MSRKDVKENIDAIRSYGWDYSQISRFVPLNEETIYDSHVRKKKASASRVNKSRNDSLYFLRCTLDKLNEEGEIPVPSILNEIPIRDTETFSEFIKKYYMENEDLILDIIRSSIEKFATGRLTIDWVSDFKERFGRINDEALAKAASEEPQFLADFIAQGNIQTLTKAMAIISLGEVCNSDFYGLIRIYIKDRAPLIREAAYRALSFYYLEDEEGKYSELLSEFKEALEKEEAQGVRKRLKSLITLMQKYDGLDRNDWDDKYENQSA